MHTYYRNFSAYLLAASSLPAAINLSVNYTAQADSELSSVQKGYFSDALNFWGSRITGYQDGVTRGWALTVPVCGRPADRGP